MSEDFDVRAKLSLSSKEGLKNIDKLADRLKRLGGQIRGTDSAFLRIGASIAGMAVGYAGISTLASGFQSMVSSAAQFESSMQGTQIGLASIMQQVEQTSFSQATGFAEGAFQRLTDMAIESTATTQQMFDIFSGIYGPIRAAGAGMETVYELTKNTTLAASALDVDFQQARRDIGAMVRGAAGVDVKLFSSLKSMGLIRENAEQFNQLTQSERVEKLRQALSGFGEAGDAYAKSLPGVTSTFTDIYEQLRRAAFRPVFDLITRSIGKVNDRLLASRERIGAVLTTLGERAAGGIGRIVDKGLDGLDYLAAHWDEIALKIDTAISKLRSMVPMIVQAGKAFLAISAARQVLGMGVSAVGTGVSAVSSLASLGVGGAGAAAEAAGGAGAAAAGGGVMAGLEAALAALAPLIAPVVAALAAVGSVGVFVAERWDDLKLAIAPMMPVLESLWASLKELGELVMRILLPPMKLLGASILGTVVPPLLVLVKVFELLVRGAVLVLEVIANIVEAIETLLAPAFDSIVSMIGMTAAALGQYTKEAKVDRILSDDGAASAAAAASSGAMSDAPGERAPTVMDFRGSKISIRQEFRDQDPDRIAVQMAEDLRRMSEYKVTSGFASALTR